MDLYTYLSPSDLFPQRGLKEIVPSISDLSPENLEILAVKYIEKYDSTSIIKLSIWLNMIFQTKEMNEIIEIQNRLLLKAGFTPLKDKILFHRHNLLTIIRLISKHQKSFSSEITIDFNKLENTAKYIISLAILNCHESMEYDFVRQLIRDFPNHFSHGFIDTIQKNRVLKSSLLFSMPNKEWKELLKKYYLKNGFRAEEIIKCALLLWNYYCKNFQSDQWSTLFIQNKNFDTYIKYFEYLSTSLDSIAKLFRRTDYTFDYVLKEKILEKDLNGFKEKTIYYYIDPIDRSFLNFIIKAPNELLIEDKIPLEDINVPLEQPSTLPLLENTKQSILEITTRKGYTPNTDTELYKSAQRLVGTPLLILDSETRCPFDLACLIDTNGALTYKIFEDGYFSGIEDQRFKDFKRFKDEIYARVSEDMFLSLVKEFFPNNFYYTADKEGYPDGILKVDNSLIILEYTTRDPGFISLYSHEISTVVTKYKNILTNNSLQTDPKAKLGQISNQIDLLKKDFSFSKIIPILITDNHFGDYDLLNNIDHFLTHAIWEMNLTNLKENKLTILSMDDFFTIFMLKETNNCKILMESLDKWNLNYQLKQEFYFSFSCFLLNEYKIKSKKFKKLAERAFQNINI
ncbi:TPA: hypothetical protein ACPSKB_001646 [Legionella feeleii]